MSTANNSFTGIVSHAGKLSNMSVSSLNAANASFSSVDGKLTEGTVVGYTPGVIVAGAGGVVGLTATPNSVAATATTAIKLPAGAVVTQVSVKNSNGVAVAGSTSFDVGLGLLVNTTSSTMFGAVLLASVNVGAVVRRTLATAAGNVSSVTDKFITVTANGADSSGEGLKVTVSYVLV